MADAPGVGAISLAMRIARQCMEGTTKYQVPSTNELPITNYKLQMNAPLRPFVPLCLRLSTHSASVSSCLRTLVMIDTPGDLYPPAAGLCGIHLDHLIVFRTRNDQDAFWAADQALRCSAVGAVIAPLGALNDRLARRLQLAAESSGCLGVILRMGSKPTHRFAAVRILMEPLSIVNRRLSTANPCQQSQIDNQSTIRRCRLTLLTVREGSPTEPFLVDLNHETGAGTVPTLSVDRAAKTG
jgi:hypothetical protein